jgi:hypothetical protein
VDELTAGSTCGFLNPFVFDSVSIDSIALSGHSPALCIATPY